MTAWRHSRLGSEIDRTTRIGFTFDGRSCFGYAGDTIASALMGAGVSTMGRSFKYHRPRSVWGMGSEEPNAIVDVIHEGVTTPNIRATSCELKSGMEVRSVNTSPDAERDRLRVLDYLHRFLPAGFYYKTFMALDWMRYEPRIRRMAGLGSLDPNHHGESASPQFNHSCDLLVIGGGPAGLAAARAAASSGRQVWLCDEAPVPGGSLRWRGGKIAGRDWTEFVKSCCDIVERAGGRVLTSTTVWGAFDHGLFAAWRRLEDGPDQQLRIRANETVLAAGSLERLGWFANNDLPGVMSAEAALYYLNCHGVVAGRDIVVATGSDASYPVAAALQQAGARVMIADMRQETPAPPEGVNLARGQFVTAAKGKRSVESAQIGDTMVKADAILVASGRTPSVHLHCQAGGKLDWDEEIDCLVPRSGTSQMRTIGAANGTFGLKASLYEGHFACGGTSEIELPDDVLDWSWEKHRPDPDLTGRQWIDLQSDVTLNDIGLAAREGFTSVEHLKRYTTLGMATDQGRTSNFGGLAAMAAQTGKTIPETGTTNYRPPFVPVPFNVIAGRRRGELFNPPKRLDLEAGHRSNNAQFREYGGWLRPAVYGAGREADLAAEEARAARNTVGVFDASPLGKLEVIGPKAAELLDFVSYRKISTLKPGRARYSFILTESGIVFDDGVVLRLGEDHFVVSASSSHVAGVRFTLEDARQDRFGGRDVFIHDVTSGWTTLTVTGPKAQLLCKQAGLGPPDIPHLGCAEVSYNGHAMRIARISFTGDISYEISVPARHGASLHETVSAALDYCGGRWIGLEAVMTLRTEKGFILIGKDTDGLTMPHDLGWGAPRFKRKDDFLGKRSLFTSAAEDKNRRQLIGLTVPDENPVPVGSHLVPLNGERRSLGFVTSSCFSPALNRPIALALLEGGFSKPGELVGCYDDGVVIEARVCDACAFDASGERLHG
ncbi:MAG: 2Fe-2S iron-sulfur cluster-binding protein [Rhizobiaceae bacterium]